MWPRRDDDVREALRSAWHDGSWGQYCSGHVERLERAVAACVGVEHVLTCASGTLAVETALRAVGVSAGDEGILAGYDYGGQLLAGGAPRGAPGVGGGGAAEGAPSPRAPGPGAGAE